MPCFSFSFKQTRDTLFEGVTRGRKQWLFSDFFFCVPVFVALCASVPQREDEIAGEDFKLTCKIRAINDFSSLLFN